MFACDSHRSRLHVTWGSFIPFFAVVFCQHVDRVFLETDINFLPPKKQNGTPGFVLL